MPIVRIAASLVDDDGEARLQVTPRLLTGVGMSKGSATLADFDPDGIEPFDRIVANQSTMFGGPCFEQIKNLIAWRRASRDLGK